MKKSHFDITTLRQLHQAGNFDAAREGYLALLEDNPDDVEALHSLGLLYVQNADFPSAITCLQKATQLAPTHAVLFSTLGNALKAHGDLAAATAAFQQAIALNPDYAAALNNLGTIYFTQGDFGAAIQAYQRAIEKEPQYHDAYYNLGLALTRQGNTIAAIDMYEALIAQAPQHGPACFQLACLLLQEGRAQEALHYFVRVEEWHPHHFETQTNLATTYLKLGQLNQAKIHYQKALELMPRDAQILFNMGVVNMQQGHTDHAIQYYQRVLQVTPDDFATHNNLGVAFLAKSHVGYALHHFREALRLQPDNAAIQYTVSVLAQDQRLLASPPDYIENLFDAYADHYDLHLQQGLDYQVPTLLFAAVRPYLRDRVDILDLGCGTGLSAAPFKLFARTLTGVDLSAKMLEMARGKQLYDQLVCANFMTLLTDKIAAYDLVLAGDALVYIGDLTTLFRDLHQALRSGGLVAFNTEMDGNQDYTMNQSGRFSHQKKYIDQLATQHGFQVLAYQAVITRQQNNEPVSGHLYVLQKR